MNRTAFEQIADGFFANPFYKESLAKAGLTTQEAVFAFENGTNLHKSSLASYRNRLRFKLPGGPTVYLKRYTGVPLTVQIKNRLQYGRRVASCDLDRMPGEPLAKAGIRTPKVIAYGAQWDGFFEKRSFILTEEIPGGVSLEKQLPECLTSLHPYKLVKERRAFLHQLADWTAALHGTGLCHRDFYLAHIFRTPDNRLVLIDLHRTFRPRLLARRYRLKDLTQLYYSAPGRYVSRADRLRFYLRYTGQNKLTADDRRFIHKLKKKASRMAAHDIRHGRPVPFAQ